MKASVASSYLEPVERLKQKLMAKRLTEETDPELRQRLRTAANESAALAWTTAYPLLVLPELFEEAGRLAQYRLERQRTLLRGGRSHTCLAA